VLTALLNRKFGLATLASRERAICGSLVSSCEALASDAPKNAIWPKLMESAGREAGWRWGQSRANQSLVNFPCSPGNLQGKTLEKAFSRFRIDQEVLLIGGWHTKSLLHGTGNSTDMFRDRLNQICELLRRALRAVNLAASLTSINQLKPTTSAAKMAAKRLRPCFSTKGCDCLDPAECRLDLRPVCESIRPYVCSGSKSLI
jgi:hypothetical protein